MMTSKKLLQHLILDYSFIFKEQYNEELLF